MGKNAFLYLFFVFLFASFVPSWLKTKKAGATAAPAWWVAMWVSGGSSGGWCRS